MALITQVDDEGHSKRRNIGLYASIVRLYGRARRGLLREWDSSLQSVTGAFNNRVGVRIGDGTWRAQVRNTVATLDGRVTVEHQWDLKSAYDTLNRRRLIVRARDANFPLAMLRMSVNSYTWVRRFPWIP